MYFIGILSLCRAQHVYSMDVNVKIAIKWRRWWTHKINTIEVGQEEQENWVQMNPRCILVYWHNMGRVFFHYWLAFETKSQPRAAAERAPSVRNECNLEIVFFRKKKTWPQFHLKPKTATTTNGDSGDHLIILLDSCMRSPCSYEPPRKTAAAAA